MPPPPTSAWMRIGELSRRASVPAETLRAWERRYGLIRPRRSAGNTRLYSAVDEARVRLMRRYLAEGIGAAQAAELALSTRLSVSAGTGAPMAAGDAEAARRALRESLAAFDEAAAETVFNRLLARYGVSAVLREVIVPVASRPRDSHSSNTGAHFTTSFLQSRLLGLTSGWSRGLGPRAVVAAAPDDHHTIGLICCGLALHQLGWQITYLGAASPLEAVRRAVAVTGARMAVLSCALPGGLDPHLETLAALAKAAALALGGPGVGNELADACGATLLDDPVAGARAVALLAGASADMSQR